MSKQSPPVPSSPNADQAANAQQVTKPFLKQLNVRGRVTWRGQYDDLTTSVAPSPAQPNRRLYYPARRDSAKSHLELQKLKNVMRCSLGHDARINENYTMHVPIAVLPSSLKSTGNR